MTSEPSSGVRRIGANIGLVKDRVGVLPHQPLELVEAFGRCRARVRGRLVRSGRAGRRRSFMAQRGLRPGLRGGGCRPRSGPGGLLGLEEGGAPRGAGRLPALFQKKGQGPESFRLRSRVSRTGHHCIRVGENGLRSLTLPVIGPVAIREDTRRLRRMLRPGSDGVPRARIASATVSLRQGRIVVTLTCEVADLHPGMRHRPDKGASRSFVGVDRGLSRLVVVAGSDRSEWGRIDPPGGEEPGEEPLPGEVHQRRRLGGVRKPTAVQGRLVRGHPGGGTVLFRLEQDLLVVRAGLPRDAPSGAHLSLSAL